MRYGSRSSASRWEISSVVLPLYLITPPLRRGWREGRREGGEDKSKKEVEKGRKEGKREEGREGGRAIGTYRPSSPASSSAPSPKSKMFFARVSMGFSRPSMMRI